jgi:hypothetical protein
MFGCWLSHQYGLPNRETPPTPYLQMTSTTQETGVLMAHTNFVEQHIAAISQCFALGSMALIGPEIPREAVREAPTTLRCTAQDRCPDIYLPATVSLVENIAQVSAGLYRGVQCHHHLLLYFAAF